MIKMKKKDPDVIKVMIFKAQMTKKDFVVIFYEECLIIDIGNVQHKYDVYFKCLMKHILQNMPLNLRPHRTLRTPRMLRTLCSLYEQKNISFY
jgi:hypothetical protein